MPGLVPGIHVFNLTEQVDVDGRDKPGHDGTEVLWITGTIGDGPAAGRCRLISKAHPR
jgi:hypothetical protein